jgi:plasmid stability protein
MKRLTIDVTEDLHRRIKMICAAHGLKMADELRRILEERFPDK